MIKITGQGIANVHVPPVHYRIAGQTIVCRYAMRELGAFEIEPATTSITNACVNTAEPLILTALNATLSYVGRAYFDREFREVSYWRSSQCAQIDVDGIPSCQVDFNNNSIHLLNDQPHGVGLNLESITGPALVLLLVQTNIYCLHAAAVDTPVGRIGITAESGAGKSTLSAHVNERWAQVADDILPLVANIAGGTVDVLPDFPQLKLANKVVADGLKPPAALDYLLRINPKPSRSIEFSVLPKTHALLQVVRHTVAAKLFDDNALKGHVSFAQRVSNLVPVIEVSYPRELNQLSLLQESIVEYLGAL